MSAAETIARVRTATLSQLAHVGIAKRAHVGLLRANAALLIIDTTQRYPDCDIPTGFWWAEGGDALKQNWELGDFDTWINRQVLFQAFGVRFHREDVIPMIAATALGRNLASPTGSREAGGRPMSALWPAWVAELAALIHEEGVPVGTGASGGDELISRVADRLAQRGLEAPGRATVQEAAKAVLRRLRDA